MAGEDALFELAARLGAISTFDRHGWVIWTDDFEGGAFKWIAGVSGTGAGVALDGDFARHGSWSAKLTAGSDSASLAAIVRVMPFPLLGRMGFEHSWAADSDLSTLQLAADVHDGVDRHRARVRYDYPNEKLQYLDASNAWVDIAASVDLIRSDYPFWTWKLVVDFGQEEYVRLIVNDAYYDLAGLAYYKAASALIGQVELGITNVATSGNNGVVYVDDVIVTRNEP